MQLRLNHISLTVAIGMLLVHLATQASAVDLGVGVGLDVGDTPSIKLKTTDNRTLTSASVAGKLVVVHFWSIRSRPSVKAAPLLTELHKQHSERGVQFLGICMDPLSNEQAKTASKQLKFTWFQTVEHGDADSRLSSQWNVRSVPQAVLISPKGAVLWRGHPAALDKPLTKAFAEHPPKPVAMIDYEVAVESLQHAELYVELGEFTEAFAAIEAISPKIMPDAAMKQLAQKINKQIAPDTSDKARLLRAAKANHPDAITRLDALRNAKLLVGTQATMPPTTNQSNANTQTEPATNHGNSHSNVSEAILISRLRLAERYAKAGNDIQAYDVYAWIVDKAGRTAIGNEAAKLVAKFEADPAFMARHRVVTQQRKAEAQLDIAEQLNKLKQIEQARVAYMKVIENYPRTVAAAKAQIQLEKLPKIENKTE